MLKMGERCMRRRLLIITTVIALSGGLRAEVIDRILATVGGALILQTDAVAAVRLGFVQPPATADGLQWTMDRLIERRLMLIEVDRYGPPEPDFAQVDQRMQQIDARIGSGERLDAILRETGLSVAQLRLYVRDDLRIEAYTQQRFGATFQPAEEAVVDYYRNHPGEFTRDGTLQPFGDVRDAARRAVMAQLRSAAIREWLSGLRRRTEVNVIYLPGR